MGRAEKVVLAYSGGVDTSVCIPYLKNEFGVKEVITLAVDLGQGDELGPVQQKALDSGAVESLVINVQDRFVKDYAFPAIQANALYENRYPLAVWISDDNLRSFADRRVVTDFPGRYCYPDGFCENGRLLFTIEINRHEILFFDCQL